MLPEYNELPFPTQQMRETDLGIKWNCLMLRQAILFNAHCWEREQNKIIQRSEKVPILLLF